MILETVVQDDKVMQNFELESLAMWVDHSQMVKAAPIASDYCSKGCANLSSSTAVSRMIKKQHFSLLEVLIAFLLVVMCIFPIIAPNVRVVQAQKRFAQVVELDHLVSLMYGDILERLYLNQIPWKDIETKTEVKIDQEYIKKIGIDSLIPFEGSYFFEIQRQKPPLPAPEVLYKVSLFIIFKPPSTWIGQAMIPAKYEYILCIKREQAS